MKIFKKTLIFGTLFFLSALIYRFPLYFDISHNKNNSLHASSVELLSKIDKPFSIELYSPNHNIHDQVQTIVSLFQKENKHIAYQGQFKTIPPAEKAKLGLQSSHTLSLTFEGRRKAIDLKPNQWSEESLAKLIYQMMLGKEQWVVFLTGHGEQDPFGEESRHLSFLTAELQSQGMKVANLDLKITGIIPDNTTLLVIADNQTLFLPKEVSQILDYLKRGGNFLWLKNGGTSKQLEKLESALKIRWMQGTIQDPKAHALGTPHPAISLINQYPEHPITKALDSLSVFPWAAALQVKELGNPYQVKPILVTNASTFLEEEGKRIDGPFTLGAALTKGEQRILLIGNGHFLSNSIIKNYGNLALASHIFNWLNETQGLIIPPPKSALDLNFTKTPFVTVSIHYLFPYLLPLGYLLLGWNLKRRRLRVGRTA